MSMSRCVDRHVCRSGRARLIVAARPCVFLLPIEQYSNQWPCDRPRFAPHRWNARERFTIATSAIAAPCRDTGKNPTARAIEPVTSCEGWRLASRVGCRSNRMHRFACLGAFRHASFVRATSGRRRLPHIASVRRMALTHRGACIVRTGRCETLRICNDRPEPSGHIRKAAGRCVPRRARVVAGQGPCNDSLQRSTSRNGGARRIGSMKAEDPARGRRTLIHR